MDTLKRELKKYETIQGGRSIPVRRFLNWLFTGGTNGTKRKKLDNDIFAIIKETGLINTNTDSYSNCKEIINKYETVPPPSWKALYEQKFGKEGLSDEFKRATQKKIITMCDRDKYSENEKEKMMCKLFYQRCKSEDQLALEKYAEKHMAPLIINKVDFEYDWRVPYELGVSQVMSPAQKMGFQEYGHPNPYLLVIMRMYFPKENDVKFDYMLLMTNGGDGEDIRTYYTKTTQQDIGLWYDGGEYFKGIDALNDLMDRIRFLRETKVDEDLKQYFSEDVIKRIVPELKEIMNQKEEYHKDEKNKGSRWL